MPAYKQPQYPKLIPAAWAVMLLLGSNLMNIFTREVLRSPNLPVDWVKAGLLLTLALVGLAWPRLRPLLHLALVLLGLFLFTRLFSLAYALPAWVALLGDPHGPPFPRGLGSEELAKLGISLAMIALLLALGYRRQDFFLARGDLNAPLEPVRWLGEPHPRPWREFALKWTGFIALGLLVFLVIGGRPNAAMLSRAAPMLPLILVYAALNAFNEEMSFRASLLAVLEPVIGSRHALWSAAVLFGIGHFYGVPYGPIGVLMATFLGWIEGKAMIETRGFFWPWFIHVAQDILIFFFIAGASIRPGG